MADLTAPLSSVHATLDDLARRLAGMAEEATGEGREEIAVGLYEAERSLKTALRRISALEREL